MVKTTRIELKGLPKISLNEWYAGTHWNKRKTTKDNYKWIVKSQFKGVFPKTKQYDCEYYFEFRIRPLDVTNTVSMIKMIEDIIFEDDNYKIVNSISINSQKGKEDKVTIIVNEL